VRTLNLGILAHVDAGKTSLTERLLHRAGVVEEIAGKKVPPAYLIEWDERTLAAMSEEYLARCEQQGLYHKMMWINEPDLDAA